MTKYRNYYIDNVIFNSKEDIDRFIKAQAIESYKRACKRFSEKPSMEMSIFCSEKAEYLHRVIGLSWEEIEEIEISAYAA